MKTGETRPHVLDAHYAKLVSLVPDLVHYYSSKSDNELQLIRAALVREQNMLGNIPLLASTTPIVFLIFGSQLGKYFPHDRMSWLVVALLSVLVIVWSINHHFRRKGRIHLDLHLVDRIMELRSEERSQKSPAPVQ